MVIGQSCPLPQRVIVGDSPVGFTLRHIAPLRSGVFILYWLCGPQKGVKVRRWGGNRCPSIDRTRFDVF